MLRIAVTLLGLHAMLPLCRFGGVFVAGFCFCCYAVSEAEIAAIKAWF
jgi:hypothetical protein